MSHFPAGTFHAEQFAPHHGTFVYEVSLSGSLPEFFEDGEEQGPVGFMVKGPTGDQTHADEHCGAFKVPETRVVSVQTQIQTTEELFVDVYVLPYDRHQRQALIPGSAELVAEFAPGSPFEWHQIDWTGEVTSTHWRPAFIFWAVDTPDPVKVMPVAGLSVLVDCLYVPENGLSVADEPYLDGDQIGGMWEGPRYLSTSIWDPGGPKPPIQYVVMPEAIVLHIEET